MIKKERFEKLAKKEAVIYKIEKEIFIAGYLSTLKIVPIKLDKDFLNIKMYDVLNDLFETKEEAQEFLEFGKLSKTEFLNLLTWEEVKQRQKFLDCITKEFVCRNKYNLIVLCLFGVDFINKRLEIRNESLNTVIFNKPLSKANYIKACRFCKKLFLGEYT